MSILSPGRRAPQATSARATRAPELPFRDAASCAKWLESVPLTHAASAQQSLAAQLERLAITALAPLTRLGILETLREPLAYVQGELAKKTRGRPMPLAPLELAAWEQLTGLWQSLHAAYQQSLRECTAGSAELARFAPLICLRSLQCTAFAMFEHYRVYRGVPAGLWRQLHEAYAFADAGGFAASTIDQRMLEQEIPDTCGGVYAHALLAHLGSPYALSARQMDLMHQWLEHWSSSVGLAQHPLPASRVPALAVDLDSSGAVAFAQDLAGRTAVRYLNLGPLSQTIRRLLGALRQGQSPADIGLGRNCPQPGCEKLLTLLHIQWCGAGTGRIDERRQAGHNAGVCMSLNSAHYYVSGKPFRQPGAAYSREEDADLQMFGRVSERTLRSQISQRSAALESWQLVNESAAGFLGMVRSAQLDAPLEHQQLLVFARDAAGAFRAGVVQWLKQDDNSDIFIGVRLLPGAPQAVAVRPAGMAAKPDKFARALLLPEVPELQSPCCLLLAPGTFQPGRFLDLHNDRTQVVKLMRLLEKGADFERVEFILPS